jgi:hypothetical protein
MYGVDTLRFSGSRFAIGDIVAMPTKREQIVYRNDQVAVVPGDERFLWVRNGLLFQLLGGGAMTLKVANDLIGHDPPFARKELTYTCIAGGLFVLGTVMHLHFDPYVHLGRRYRLEWVQISPRAR